MSNRHFTITNVEPLTSSRLLLTFADSEKMQVDLSGVIPRHPSLAPLADSKIFKTAEVGEWGGSIVWNKDDNLELAADNLRARAIEQAGGCSHERIWNWMAKNNLTLDTAASAIGLSRRMLAYYRSGEKPVPLTVALAIVGWEAIQKSKPSKPSRPPLRPDKVFTVVIESGRVRQGGSYIVGRENALAARGGNAQITAENRPSPTKPPKSTSEKRA